MPAAAQQAEFSVQQKGSHHVPFYCGQLALDAKAGCCPINVNSPAWPVALKRSWLFACSTSSAQCMLVHPFVPHTVPLVRVQ